MGHWNSHSSIINERTTPVSAKNTAPNPGPAWYDSTSAQKIPINTFLLMFQYSFEPGKPRPKVKVLVEN